MSDFETLNIQNDETDLKDLGSTGSKHVILGNGVNMPVIAAGTWQYESAVASDSVFEALEVGFRHIDTAYNHQNQDGVSKGIKKFLTKYQQFDRDDIFLTTKVPGCGSDGVSFDSCGDDTQDIIEKSLKVLEVSHFDLFLIHFPPLNGGCSKSNCDAIRHQYKALQHAFMNKKTRSIGVSNFCKGCIDCIMSWEELQVKPVVNQIKLHVGMGPNPEEIVAYSKQKGMVVQAYSPLENGNEEIMKATDILNIANTYKRSLQQISLRWLLQNDVIFVTKSKNEGHFKANLDLFSWKLNEKDMNYLNMKNNSIDTPSYVCNDD